MEKKRRGILKIFFGLTFRFVLTVAALSLLLSYISVAIDPAKFSIPLFFGLYFIPILIINIILLLIAFVCRSKSVWIPILIVTPSLLFAERFFKISGNAELLQSRAPEVITLQTYNVGRFRLSKEKLSQKDLQEMIAESIKKYNPDIVCLQEVLFKDREKLRKMLPEYGSRAYHLFPSRWGGYGNLILSKFPIANAEKITFGQSRNLCLYADIVIGADTVRVYNNHLESNRISLTTLIKKIRDKNSSYEEVGEQIKQAHSKVRHSVILRSKQVNAVYRNVEQSPYPSIVCGDLNDTPMSYTYNKLAEGKKDTFKESGKGFGASYSTLWPLLRIDYVFLPENFEPLSHKTERIELSDHYPVITQFLIKKR